MTVVYSYHGQGNDGFLVSFLFSTLCFLAAISVQIIINLRHDTKSGNIKAALSQIKMAGLFFGALSMASFVYLYTSRNNLIEAAKELKCQEYTGVIEYISPMSGSGNFSFSVSGKEIQYDNHAIALHEILCAGIKVCVGDKVSICAAGREILRIQKMAKANRVTDHPSL